MALERILFVQDADHALAQVMLDALWDEIQERYGFSAPNVLRTVELTGSGCGIWLAMVGDEPVGSIALRQCGFTRKKVSMHERRWI